MNTDSVNRRLRRANPQPSGERIVLRPSDIALFAALDRHGHLPSNYLFDFVKGIRGGFNYHQHRLTKLFNGTTETAPYLTRPPQQFQSYEAYYQPLIYDLAPPAKTTLGGLGLLHKYSPERGDHFLHRFMGACVSASMELTAPELGLRYIPREEILASIKCPDATKEAKNPLAIPLSTFAKQNAIVPDDIFGLQYPDGSYRFFAVEIDRNTESISRKKDGYNTFAKKIDGYFDILRNRTFKTHFGLPNLIVLTVTTNASHAMNLVEHVKKQNEPTLGARFMFKTVSHFGNNWKVPREILKEVLTEPWLTTGAPFDISKI